MLVIRILDAATAPPPIAKNNATPATTVAGESFQDIPTPFLDHGLTVLVGKPIPARGLLQAFFFDATEA
jgi:hypothetical protein